MMIDSKDVVIVIPIYKRITSKYEIMSFKRIVKVFCNRDIRIVSPESNHKYITELCDGQNNIDFELFENKYFKSIKGYNRLLMSKEFYKRFEFYTFMLICQLDVYVFKDELNLWLNKRYDNIGAPIFRGYSMPSAVFQEIGNNGGFCLRNIQKCIKVLDCIKFRYFSITTILRIKEKPILKLFRFFRDGLLFNYNVNKLKPIINEDIFWSVIVPIEIKSFKSCPPNEAMYFAFDANPKYLYKKTNNNLPLAIHGWWRYDLEFVKKLIQLNVDE